MYIFLLNGLPPSLPWRCGFGPGPLLRTSESCCPQTAFARAMRKLIVCSAHSIEIIETQTILQV